MRRLDLSRFKNASHLSSGRHSGLFSGSGIEFKELREYSGAADSRSIDWKASLRSGKTLERSYVPDREIPVWFVLDVSSSMGYGKPGERPIDAALRAFDLVSRSALEYGNVFGAVAFCDRIVSILPPSRSFSRAQAFRQMAESALSGGEIRFSEGFPIEFLRSRIRSKSVVFAASDQPFEFESAQNLLLKRSHAFVLRIRHPLEDANTGDDVPAFQSNGCFSFVAGASIQSVPVVNARFYAEVAPNEDPYPALEKLLSGTHGL
jgi:uncharacterized protein (DUF58 family)